MINTNSLRHDLLTSLECYSLDLLDINSLNTAEPEVIVRTAFANRLKTALLNNDFDDIYSQFNDFLLLFKETPKMIKSLSELCSSYFLDKREYVPAIDIYARARKQFPHINAFFYNLLEYFISYYFSNKTLFVSTDLRSLLNTTQQLHFYCQDLNNVNEKQLSGMIRSIQYRIKYEAADKVEGFISHQVQRITNAIDQDVPMEQVTKEYGKFIKEILRKRASEPKKNIENDSES